MRIPPFFPSTFVCPTEIIAFSDKASEFHDVNCEVVAVSVDSHFSHLAWINTPRKVYTRPPASALVIVKTAGSHERPSQKSLKRD